ncbi:MAG: TonB-dependent receptor [Pseudomonadota bacterium]
MFVNDCSSFGWSNDISLSCVGKLTLVSAMLAIAVSHEAAQASDLDLLLQAEEAILNGEAVTKQQSGVSISVDGETIVGSVDVQDKVTRTDKALQSVDIQVKFDGLDVSRRLNITTQELRRTYKPGEVMNFIGSWNYPQWIERAEVRIFRQVDKYATEVIAAPLHVIDMPVEGSVGEISWQSPETRDALDPEKDNLVYVLRVYDRKGRFDETTPLSLKLSENGAAIADRMDSGERSFDQNENRTGVSNIPLHGGTITVHGKNVPSGYQVQVLGESVAVARGGSFVTSHILPAGDHVVDVSVSQGGDASGLHFERDINFPDEEWFYVGLADLTIGQRFGEDAEALAAARPGEFSETYERGRLAFYLKGKVKGETLITAALDTTEEDLDDILRNLDDKDPRRLLRNLDPDDFYPVYGDDSTTVEDAPTSGKFYVRVERGQSHVMWGNFKSRIDETELTRFERGLYGAHAVLQTPQSTSHGEAVGKVEAFAADAGSLPQRDEFQGTGGSAYFLRRQDIREGSEQVTIEERDRVSGQVISRTLLRPGQDYEFDAVQGVILLKSPLASTTGTTGAVRQESIGGNHQFLVVVYEYTPALTDLDGFSYGGRAQGWLEDRIRFGVTGYTEDTGSADQNLYGGDVLVRLSEKSYFEFEWAESEGDTFGLVRSADGGFIFNSVSGVNATGGTSRAYRGKLALDLGEVSSGALNGTIGAYHENREAGFNAPGRYTSVDERLNGFFGDVELTEDTRLRAKYDEVDRADGSDRTELSAEIEHRLDRSITGSIGVTHSDQATAIGSSTGTGERTDIGARLTRTFENDDRAWVFGQGTVNTSGTRERNDRGGVGLETAITDKITATGEVSYGTQGIGGLASVKYAPNADDNYFLGYRLDPDTTAGDLAGYDPFGRDYGSLVFGANRRVNDQLTAFFEENYDFTGTQRSLTHTYGATYKPDDVVSLSGGIEAGEVRDRVNGDFERFGVSGSVSMREETRQAHLRLEARFEEGINANARDRNTYLLTSNFSHKHNDDWRFIAKLDGVLSQSDQQTILDGDYVEGSLGWAYRPAESDRLNALLRYGYLEDLPGAQQVNAQNQLLGPRQRSHVLEGDFIYNLTERMSVGGKYGYRIGEVEAVRGSGDFTESSAHLGIARLDWHVVKKWDLMIEARQLWLEEVEQTKTGYLAGVYRHIGEKMKLGVGYNFGEFSDDITDLTYDDEGVFLNVVGKF